MYHRIFAAIRAVCLFAFLCAGAAHGQTAESPIVLTWDTGETEAGVNTVAQPSNVAGKYYYRINARSAEVWRTRLMVTSGEASLTIAKGAAPGLGGTNSKTSQQIGNDGIVLSSSDFAAGENWYIMVEATGPSNSWTLVTGDPYIQDLGTLPFTDANGDGAYNIGEASQNGGVTDKIMGPEGVAFYKVTLPPNVPAWALWMNGGQQLIGVRKNLVPALFKATPLADRKRNGNLLLVPPYLGQGLDSYFVSVQATAGSTYSLDSRIQQIEDIAFDGTTPSIQATGSPYRVFRVEVPVEQVIWDVSLERLSGDPNLCVRKQTVPAENDNDAISEAAGAVNDSVTLVSPDLTNGTWFITLFGNGPYEANLKSGTPVITDIGYRSTVTNDQPNRSGWRYYRVPDMAAQIGTLGWQLDLDSAPQGTEIAIRRALAPGTWKQKNNGATSPSSIRYVDFSSTNGLLQRVDHEADIWYVGVYQPDTALGNYTLTLNDIVSSVGTFDGYDTQVTNQIEGEWRYFRVNVPNDAALLGWYVDLSEVVGTTTAKITVRRDRLPPAPSGSPAVTADSADWASGTAWAQTSDFSGIMQDYGGKNVAGNHFLAALGPYRPLKPGTYYVGVLAGNAQPAAGTPKKVSYRLRSRGIGGTYAIPVTPLPYANGQVTLTDLAPRDFRFYSLTIPQGIQVPSWDLSLTPTAGEMHMQVRRDSLPDFSSSALVGEISGPANVQGGKRLKKPGAEKLTLLPEQGQTFLQPGTYYTAVISEGATPTTSALGANPSTGTFAAKAPSPVIDLGTVSSTPITTAFDLPSGELTTYRITVPAGARLLEAYITGRTGNPGISLIKGTTAPKPFPATSSGTSGYGWVGGQTSPNHPVLVSAHEPDAGVYTLIVRANPDANAYPNGAGTLNIRTVQAFPAIDALGGVRSQVVTDQIAESWRYFTLTVPNNASIKGVYVSLQNVTSGVPRMVIRKGTGLPKDFTTTNGLSSDSASWPADAQWYQANDYTAITKSSAGNVVSGRGFLCAYNAPMEPGVYTIGVTKDSSVNTVSIPNTPNMNYTIRVDCVGVGLDYDLVTLQPNNTAAPEFIPALGEREHRFYKVTIPAGMSSWRVKLGESYTSATPPVVRDGMLTIRKNQLPAFDSTLSPISKGGASVKILGQGDHWVILPSTASGTIDAGDYYIAVTSLGQKPTTSQTGSGTSDLTLITRGEMPTQVISPQVGVETLVPYSLGAAEVAAYEFTVPSRSAGQTPYGFVLSMARSSGMANFSARLSGADGSTAPVPPGVGSDGFFGGLPSQYSSSDTISGQIVYQATPGTYRVIVRSTASNSTYTPVTGSLSVQLLDPDAGIPTLRFDGESFTVNNAGATTDILPFRVIVPNEPNWKAWGIRLVGPQLGKPSITIRRDQPVEATAGPLVTSDSTDWPSLSQWSQAEDYTKFSKDPITGDRIQQYFVAARDRPLKPGTYYVGINNYGTALISPRTFTIQTFAFGDGYTVPVSDLSTIGSVANISIAEPRMPVVHKITIPAQTRAWAVSLSATLGDFTLRVRKDYIPDPVNTTSPLYPDAKGGVHVQKAGDERFTLLPKAGENYITPGDYYIAVVSEGQNASTSSDTVGTGTATGTLTNLGPVSITPLGTANDAGLTQQVSLEPAEVKFFTVDVPAGINNLQFRLNDRAGEATIVVVPGTRLPAPALTSETYGVFGGETASLKKDKAIVNLGNPAAGTYTVAVRAGANGSAYASASATLSVDILKPVSLNFSETLNASNGLSHTDARSLADKQKYFYRVAVPQQVAGADVLGWLVTLDQGSPIVRFYKSEADFGTTAPVTMVGRTALIVPPLLTTGTNWFIEVEGVGTTDYVIRSQPVSLTAAPWTLPNSFNQHAGDSNPGAPDGVGVGRELAQDYWEFYALDVTDNNLGLMRYVLESSNGNPNVYIRYGGIPTSDHKTTGGSGSVLYDFRMMSEDSEAGNFSEVSNTTQQPDRLRPGRWYIGVKSDPVGSVRTSSRYRLKAHSGVVTDMDINTPIPLTAQNLSEKDWRYYRVTIPRTGVPASWLPTFTRLSGTAQLYIRDTLPPFSIAASNQFVDWGTDLKNKVLSSAYLKALAPGTITLPVPPLRPGKTYFLGFYGASGGSFEVSSAASASPLFIDAEMAYNSGSTSFTIPPNQKRLIRFHAPMDATRIKFDCQQSSIGLLLKVEQGAPPDTTVGVTAHLQNNGIPLSYSVNQKLGLTWPFVAYQDYYLLLSNPTAAPIDSTITMKGVNALTEDEDGDLIPDAWERQYFASTTYNQSSDPDGDGSTNYEEYLYGTNPTDPQSVRFSVVVTSPGGSASITPQQESYAKDTLVTLKATPAVGDAFQKWIFTGSTVSGASSSVTLPVQANITAKAIFTTSLRKSLDTPTGQSWSTTLGAAWFGQYEQSYDGVDAACSPPLPTPALGQESMSEMVTFLNGPGTLTFRWKVSSRPTSHRLSVWIDGTEEAAISGTTMTDWEQVSLTIPTGSHSAVWRYSKTASTAQGQDRGWVDQVTYTGFPSEIESYSTWSQTRFTTAEQNNQAISGPAADPDRDGINNLMEAALGADPKAMDAMKDALRVVGQNQSGANRIISLESKLGATAVANITLRLETKQDLAAGSWTTLATKVGSGVWSTHSSTSVTTANSGGTRVPVTFQETSPVSGSSRRFYRITAEITP